MGTNELEIPLRLTGIRAAVLRAGSQKALAKLIGVTQQVVSLWVKRGFVTDRFAHAVARATGVPTATLIRPEKANS